MPDDFTRRVKIYYDAEFTGLHRNTSLISIGLVSESGAYFYAEFNDYDREQVDDWLKDNVIDSLLWNDKDTYSIFKEFWSGSTNGQPMGPGAKKHFNVLMKSSRDKIKKDLLFWLKWESDAGGAKVQFYTDCYAYDWVTLMEVICDEGKALNLPSYIDYIPIDLSTAMLLRGDDPDTNREEYAGEYVIKKLQEQFPFNGLGEKAKHNSLWDATVACWCFYRVLSENNNRRIYSEEALQKALEVSNAYVGQKLKGMTWQGEKDHPPEE